MAYHKKGNIIIDKSFIYACDIVNFCKILKEKHEFEISHQLIKCGTSIGANVRESQRGVSAKDFKNKLGIALKEAEETKYWLEIIETTTMEIPNDLLNKCEELIKLLVSIIKNS
ncbi:MAG TPA: four helix bundle protein [Flavobacteriaceae bacterium]|nr:four helix bundle protein [Flavobacteriaceae bacterium]